MRKFVHDWDPEDFQTNVLGQREPPPEVRIVMELDNDGFWLAANHAGYQWLARLFAEIADSDLEDGWHTHRDKSMGDSDQLPEFTFGVGTYEVEQR